jgi:hypothetical protein
MKTLPEQIAAAAIDLLAERLNYENIDLSEVPVEICSLQKDDRFVWSIKVTDKAGKEHRQEINLFKEFYHPYKPDEVKACMKQYFLELCVDRSKEQTSRQEFEEFIAYLKWVREERGN